MPKVGICLFASILLALLVREAIAAEKASNLELEQLKGEIEAAKNQLTSKVNQDLIDKYFGMNIEFQELLTVAKVHFLLIKYGLKKVMPYEERGFPEKVHLLEGPDQELIALFDETRNRMFFELIFQPKTVEKALHQLELLLRRLLILNNAWEKRRVAQQQAVANNVNSVFVVRWLKWIGELVLKWDQQPAVRRNGHIYCERQFRHFGAGEEMCELIYHLKKALKAGAEVYEESEQMMSAEEKQELKLYTGLFWMQSVVNAGIDLHEVIKAHKNCKEHNSDKGEASSIKLKESAQTVKRMVRIWLGQEAKISMKLAAAAEGQTT